MCAASDIVLLTDGNSKSFWLTRLRMYSIRYRFCGHANCTGGVRVLIAVTMVCHKQNILSGTDDRKTEELKQFWCFPLLREKCHEPLTSIASLILFLMSWIFCFFSLKQTYRNNHWHDCHWTCIAVTYWQKSVFRPKERNTKKESNTGVHLYPQPYSYTCYVEAHQEQTYNPMCFLIHVFSLVVTLTTENKPPHTALLY